MRKLVFQAENRNWNVMGPGDLIEKDWYIYDDLTIELKECYNTYIKSSQSKTYNGKMNKKDFQKILSCIESVKAVNLKPTAMDGDAWEFTQFKNNALIYRRKLGYIYGIKPLEDIVKILRNIKLEEARE